MVITELVAVVLHEYVFAPPAVNVAVCPTQITLPLLVAKTLGVVLTVTDSIAVFIQPLASVPVTV